MICAERDQPRKEWILRSNTMAAIRDDFEVYSALYGDGESRYTDVTKTVQGWTRDGIWPENWEKVLYATRKPRLISINGGNDSVGVLRGEVEPQMSVNGRLVIHNAYYGIGDSPDKHINVTEHLQSLVQDHSLDIIVNNSTLTPNQNPFRGKKKTLRVRYSIDGGTQEVRLVEEKDWLIIGPVQRVGYVAGTVSDQGEFNLVADGPVTSVEHVQATPLTAPALNDFLIRRFSISPQRLRGPMPIELRDFHRNDLAQLFAELGFKRGAEIGVAEGKYSEILLKANPECELSLVDPWHAYSDNPQNKTKEKNEYAFNETRRKIEPYKSHVTMIPLKSMDAIYNGEYGIDDESLDFVYIDGHHSYPYVMCDIIEWSKKVRSGGIVAGDDVYKLNDKWGAGPMEAIYDYTRAMRINPWWLIAAHKSVDFFFVKP